jgi:CheY-like chemotaxis protein
MANPADAAAPALLLSDDLIFASRITGAASAVGQSVRRVRSTDELSSLARQQPPRCVLVDLAFPGLVLGDLLAALRGCCSDMPRVVAYGSHVDVAGLTAARAAGCDPVLPRSKFVEELPTELETWLRGA